MRRKISYSTLVTLLAVFATVAIYAIMIATGLPCPIKYVSGISCAGCGMTRAVASAIRGDFAAAFYYHPLWLFVPIAIVVLLVAHFKKMDKLYNATLMIGASVMVVVWIIRLIHPECDVVTADLDGGVVGWIKDVLR